MIFFSTSRYAAFLSSGLFHFLIGVFSLLFMFVTNLPSSPFAGLLLLISVCRGRLESAYRRQCYRIVDRVRPNGDPSIRLQPPPAGARLPFPSRRERIRSPISDRELPGCPAPRPTVSVLQQEIVLITKCPRRRFCG